MLGKSDRGFVGLRLLIIGAVLAMSLAASVRPASAHSPHDDVFDVAVSPQFGVDRTILTVSRGLLLRSTDGGASWHRQVRGLDNRGAFYAVAYAGGSTAAMYSLSTDGAFRSTDGGLSWNRVYSPPSTGDLHVLATSPIAGGSAVIAGATTGASITSSNGASWRALGATTASVTAVSYSPSSAQVVLVGDATGSLHATGDGGLTWTHHPLGAVGTIRSIAPSPSFGTDGLALIGTNNGGVLRWDAHTNTATAVNSGLTDQRVTSLAFSAGYPTDRTIFASTWNTGTFVSNDDGGNWRKATTGLLKSAQADEPAYADRPHFGELITAFGDAASMEPKVFLASFTGIYSSSDQATSWNEIGKTESPGIVVGLALSPSYGTDRKLAVMSYVNSARKSSDGGETWQPSNLGLAQRSYWNADSDSYLRGFNVVYGPTVAGSQWMFAASDPGVYRSSDGGASWRLTPVAGFANPRLSTIAVAPRVFVSPSFATDHTVLMVDTGAGDVYRSTDEGASFQKVGAVPSAVHCLQAAPTFSVDHRLLACTGRGVYVSTNLGTTWTATTPLLMYDLAVAVSGATETWLAATSRGLYRSTNRGVSWVAAAPALTGPIGAVAASPPGTGAATVIVSTKGKGLYRSTDGGTTFTLVAPELLVANEQFNAYPYRNTGSPIVFSPSFATDRTVFGASHTELFRSTDGGTTWQRLSLPYAVHSGIYPVIPAAPAMNVLTGGDQSISVGFTPPPNSGTPILHFDVTCTSSDVGAATPRSAAGLTSPVTVATLTNDKTYTCRITATNLLGTSPPSTTFSAVVPTARPPEPPSSPSNVTGVPGNLQATLTWAAPASDGRSPITGYAVTPHIGYFPLARVTFSSVSTTQTITGLTNGVTYRFKVAAINGLGTGSLSTASGAVTPGPVVPAAPGRPSALGQAQSAQVSWAAPASDGGSPITGYTVTPYVGYFALAGVTFGSVSTSQTITGLTPGVTYRFKVAAINAVGTGSPSLASNLVTAT